MTPQLKVPDVFFFFKDIYRMNKCAVGSFPQRFEEVPWTSRPGNTAVHPDKLRFWTANQQSAQRKAPFASQPHCFVTLEIKTSDSRGCNTPQLRNMWHRRICPQPVTFLETSEVQLSNPIISRLCCVSTKRTAPSILKTWWRRQQVCDARWLALRRFYYLPSWKPRLDVREGLAKKEISQSNFLEKLCDIDQQLVLAKAISCDLLTCLMNWISLGLFFCGFFFLCVLFFSKCANDNGAVNDDNAWSKTSAASLLTIWWSLLMALN